LAQALALTTLVLLAACQVRPLYAPAATGIGPQAALPAIHVDEPISREEQVFRNALLFGLRGDAEGEEPRYDLVYRMTIREQPILIERGTGTPGAHQLTGGVSFLLKDRGAQTSLFGASVTAVDTYTRSSQNFASLRARRDAEDRLANALAELTQARLAAYFATQ
jgi:LPS-assembly lipoprotein